MNAATDLPRSLPVAAPQPRVPEARVFVRTLSAPPGMPWDQARSAALEARMGAPLPLDEVVWRLRRLEPWALGRPARYVACYVRRREAGADFTAEIEADGRRLTVRFLDPAAQRRLAERWGLMLLAAAAVGLSLTSAVGSALSVRAETEARLADVEQLAAARLREAEGQRRLAAQARLLNAAGAGPQTAQTLLDDLAWASRAKTADAHIDALHWEHGYLAVEARGEAAPFGQQAGREVLKANQPLRPGVWLWGVGPARLGGGRP